MKKVFVTGESGVIPKYIIKNAAKFDFEIVNNKVNEFQTFQAFECREKEIDFTNTLFEQAIKKYKPEIIIHSGAFVGTDYCQNKQLDCTISNVYGTKNIVDICNKYNIKLVYFSTTAIFDTNDYSVSKPITEKTKINPKTFYGITKYAGELIVKNECKTKNIIIRPVFGFSEFPHDLHSALTKVIYSSVYDLKLEVLLNKKISKSYIHAENIANCVLRILNNQLYGEIFNVGKNYNYAKNWFQMFDIIESFGLKISDKIDFNEKEDYLHWHNINNDKISDFWYEEREFETDVKNVIESCKNSTIKPYWL